MDNWIEESELHPQQRFSLLSYQDSLTARVSHQFSDGNRTKSCPKYIYDRTKVYILGRRSQFPYIKTGEAENAGVRYW